MECGPIGVNGPFVVRIVNNSGPAIVTAPHQATAAATVNLKETTRINNRNLATEECVDVSIKKYINYELNIRIDKVRYLI